MSIKILWLEDEFKNKQFVGTIAKAKKYGFEIIFCEYAYDFIEQIDIVEWDAIILDVIGKTHAEGTLGSDGFNLAFDKILTSYKNQPWFVFSGQTEITKKDSIIRERLDAEHCKRDYARVIYVKGNDNERLWEDITNIVTNKEEWLIRQEYADIFSTFVDKTLILRLLKALNKREKKDTSLLNDVRKVLEDIFDRCLVLGLFEPYVRSINDRARRLGGHPTIPKYIQKNIQSVAIISQEGSHIESQTYKDIVSGKSPRVIISTIAELLNIILWCDQLIKK